LPNQEVSGHLDAAQTQKFYVLLYTLFGHVTDTRKHITLCPLHAQNMHNKTQVSVSRHHSIFFSKRWTRPRANKEKKYKINRTHCNFKVLYHIYMCYNIYHDPFTLTREQVGRLGSPPTLHFVVISTSEIVYR
jgi:hypothetical protein